MTGYTPLDNLLAALTGNSALMTMVGSKIFKNKAISASAVDIYGDPAKSQISCELSDLCGQILSADQVFVVDIGTEKKLREMEALSIAPRLPMQCGLSWTTDLPGQL